MLPFSLKKYVPLPSLFPFAGFCFDVGFIFCNTLYEGKSVQTAVKVTSLQLCFFADLCILQQNVKFPCSTGIKEEPNITVASWKNRPQWFISRDFTCQKCWEVNSFGAFNLFQIKNNEN